jgi:protein-S-isoprenylcysteine O-methyltransferase Ste14
MSALALVVILDAVLMGALPRIFFRRDGRLNLRWWLTAAPFFAGPGTVLLAACGLLAPWRFEPAALAAGGELAAVASATASIGLMCFTLGTHRIPIALWHQVDDAPRHVVTWGAYGRIRHPFYASFLLLLAACLLACPHPITAAAFVWGAVALNATAAREEARLRRSELGADYAAYMRRTGRFFPRLTT